MRQIRLRNFEYHAPSSVDEACRLLRELDDAVAIAGGTDLVPRMKHEFVSPRHLVSLQKIEELRNIERRDGRLVLGACVRLSTLTENDEVRRSVPVLSETAALMASPQVRNLATIGGNVANSSPSADMLPPLMALDAVLVLENGGRTREVAVESFCTGPGENVLEEGGGEVVKEIVIPLQQESSRALYFKHTVKKGLELAIVGVALCVSFDGRRTVSRARIALGAVAPTPIRAKRAEDVLQGERLQDSVIGKAASLARAAASPIDDPRGSKWYRSDMVELWVRRGLETLARVEH